MPKCRSCGAEIIWSLTASGKKTPLDKEPDRFSGTVYYRGGYAKYLSGADLDEARRRGDLLYVPHWANCPPARDWRRNP
jgi:hypothetical protein